MTSRSQRRSFSSSPVRSSHRKGLWPKVFLRKGWGFKQIFLSCIVVASILLNIVIIYRFANINDDGASTGRQKSQSGDRAGRVQASDSKFSKSAFMIQYQNFGIEGASFKQMHGRIGIKPDGTSAWTTVDSPPKDLNIARALSQGGGFNIHLSDSISLDREVPDSRLPQCHDRIFNLEELVPVSVVIVFHNEHFSTLMRSVHSVLNRTHPKILHEIILVDDGSTLDSTREGGTGQLVEYIKYLPKVKLLRNPRRLGIVGARMTGIKAVHSTIFAVLDSHIEVEPHWLEPLIQRILEDRTRIVMPQVDGIEADTFKHTGGGIGCKVGFIWKLMEHSYEFHQMEKYQARNPHMSNNPTAFESSPTMSGGLFAANKKFFFEVGAYDEGFVDWGTENLEFSFRVWMCGGRIECAPCSRVYHIFRKGGSGYSVSPGSLTNNKIRTLLWMDEYADLAYKVLGEPKSKTYGAKSLQDRRKWRNDRGCKSFRWYLQNVYPESDVLTLHDVPYLGQLKNSGRCLDNHHNDEPGVSSADLQFCNNGRSQKFMYFKNLGHIMPVSNDEACMADNLKFEWCRAYPEQHYEYTTDRQLKNKKTSECIGVSMNNLVSVECNYNDSTQIWDWDAYEFPEEFTLP